MGMLDAAAPRGVVVNGPEDDVLDWGAVAWRVVEDDVRRLRQRIFTATQAGDFKKVRNLQKLMLRSRANALMSVRRVTEVNAGRMTLFGAGSDADDVVQEAFVNAFCSLNGFRAEAPFRPWLLSIVVNQTHNLHRSARRRAGLALRVAGLPEDPAGQRPDPSAVATVHGQRAVLLDAVRALPERDRAVVTCRYLLELSETETAVALGWPAGTVKSRLSRALQRLHRDLPGGKDEWLDDGSRVHRD
jgi:RNA polymerase sigma factor (sigma-70 family)